MSEQNTILDDVSNNTTPPSNEGEYLSKYVGEGKKYRTVEDLAKAYDHANSHIERVTGDNSHLREEFEAFRELMTTQLSRNNDGNRQDSDPNANPKPKDLQQEPAPSSPPKEGSDEEVDLESRIAKILEERDSETRKRQNAQLAEEVMVKHFGSKDDAVKAVRDRAAELGVSDAWLASVAFTSPKAFFAQMDINPETPPRSTNTPNPKSDIDPYRLKDLNPSIRPGTYDYYQEIRRKNPSKYYSFEVQKEIMENAIKLGADFYNRKT